MNVCRLNLRIVLFAATAAVSAAQTNTFPASGNVGIGTTNPLGQLSVAGVLRLDNGVTQSNYFTTMSANYDSAHPFSLKVENNLGGTAQEVFGIYSTVGGGSTNVIFPSGNVGIGTTYAPHKLTVVSSAISQPQIQFGVPSATAGVSSAALTFAGWGIEHAGINWIPNWTPNDHVATGRLDFAFGGSDFPGNNTTRVSFLASGNVGIGTTNPTQKLSVNGTVRAKEVIVDSGWSDYVFDEGYKLAPLSQVEREIKTEKHLPGIPSAKEVAEHGVSVGEMQARLLAKIEELTLHQIEQEKQIQAVKAENTSLRRVVEDLQSGPTHSTAQQNQLEDSDSEDIRLGNQNSQFTHSQ